MNLTDWTALIAVIVGTAGFVLSVLNYLADRPRVVVSLKWDMAVTDNPRYDPKKLWALVTVANAGRRPIYLSHVSLKLPKGYPHTHLILAEGLLGKKLSEGDPPYTCTASQDNMAKYSRDWDKIRAVAFDVGGREYTSSRRTKSNAPSWAQVST